MRPPHALPLLLLALACEVPNWDTAGGADSGRDTAIVDGPDTGGPDPDHDTGTPDTGRTDTGRTDTGRTDTGSGDSDTADTADTSDPGGTGESGDVKDTAGSTDTGMPLPSAPITLFAVRHAEKESEGEDPGLTEEGQARAEALAVLMHDEPLAAIYATEYTRTQQTVQPTADDHGLSVVTDIDPEGDLALYLLSHHGGDTVLHAGHSYSLPELFESLGVSEVPEDYDYGDLWILEIDVDGSVTIEESHYGD